jgi:hypothetical protein
MATRNPLPGFATLYETEQQDHILDYQSFERSAPDGRSRRCRGSCQATA